MKYISMMLVLLALIPAVSATINLSQNQTFVFTYTNATNNVQSEIFYCSAHNESFCKATNLTINLTAGQTSTVTNGSCSVFASCSAPVACSIIANIEPGQTYTNGTGLCNVTIVAQKEKTVNVPQRQNVSIKKNGQNIELRIGDKNYNIPLDVDSFDYSQMFELQCPADPKIQDTEDVDYLIQQCRSWVPMLDDTISTLVANTKTCSDSARTHVDDIKTCGDRERAQLEVIGTLQAKSTADSKELENAIKARLDAELLTREEAQRADTNKVLAWIFGVVFFITLAFTIVLAMTTQVRGGGK